jgi:hypothetical protein
VGHFIALINFQSAMVSLDLACADNSHFALPQALRHEHHAYGRRENPAPLEPCIAAQFALTRHWWPGARDAAVLPAWVCDLWRTLLGGGPVHRHFFEIRIAC